MDDWRPKESWPCGNCGWPVGKDWAFWGMVVVCSRCAEAAYTVAFTPKEGQALEAWKRRHPNAGGRHDGDGHRAYLKALLDRGVVKLDG